MTEAPIFDSSRAALAFALSTTRTRYAAPLMSKMMSEIKLAEKPLKKSKKPPKEPALTRARRSGLGFSGLDAAAQAGMILLHFAKLTQIEQAVLACCVTRPRLDCSCGSPCCRGWLPNPEFVDGLQAVEEWVRQQMDMRAVAAGKQRNRQEALHRALIESHFGVGLKTLKAMAVVHEVSPQTVITHRDLVVPLLESLEKAGWSRLDGFLVQAGIVGVC